MNVCVDRTKFNNTVLTTSLVAGSSMTNATSGYQKLRNILRQSAREAGPTLPVVCAQKRQVVPERIPVPSWETTQILRRGRWPEVLHFLHVFLME